MAIRKRIKNYIWLKGEQTMRLVKKNINSIEHCKHVPGKIQAIVTEFVESDMDCAEVVDHDCKNGLIATGCVNKAIKALKINSVKAVSRDGHCYIFREDKK